MLAGAAQAVTIDDFGAGSLVFVSASSSNDSQVTDSMLGGERDETISNTSASGGILAGASGGDYSYGALNATGSALLVWDGVDGSPALDATGLGGVDLTESGSHTHFAIEILSNDFVADLVLTVYTSVGDFSAITVATPGGIPSGPSQTLMVAYADFVPTGSGADFTNVGAITLLVDGSLDPQLDLTLGSFATSPIAVPEPVTAAQLVLGLVGLALARRSRLA
ncbi:MAG: hypothetical protein ACQGVC_11310 [Myxococcota bacterium]